MTISINSAWTEAASRDVVEPCFLLTITDGTSTWNAQSSDHDTMLYPMGVIRVGELAPEIDVVTRRLEIGEIEALVSDAWLRPILVSNRLFGHKATIKLGFRDLAEGSFVNYHIGSIDRIQPDGIGKTVRLSIMSALELARRQKIVGYWVDKHPLDIINDILINKIGVHADLVDSTSLDPDSYTGISHFVAARVNIDTAQRGVTELTEGFALVDQLAQMCNGTLYVNEDGKVSFRVFDATASEAATWTTTDIVSLEQTSLDAHAINRCEVTMAPLLGAIHMENNVAFAQEDATSIADLAYPGTTERRITHKLDAAELWLMGGGALSTDGVSSSITAAVTVGIVIHGSDSGSFTQGVCGTREGHLTAYPAGQPANAKISAARPLYLLTNAGEIIKATGLAPTAGTTGSYSHFVYTQDPETGDNVSDGPHHDMWTLTGVTRAALGTTAAAATSAVDITIPVYLATTIIDRHSHGLAMLDVVTTLRHYDKEPGDLVKVVWPSFLDYNRDGVTGASGKWEILAKEVDAAEGTIKWSLAWAGLNSPSYSYSGAHDRTRGIGRQIYDYTSTAYAVQKHKVSGLGVTTPSGLDITVAAGTAASGKKTAKFDDARTITLGASKDYYVIFDVGTSGLTVYEAALGGAAPYLTGSEIRLAKVVTGAAAVSSIDTTTSVPTKAVPGDKLESGSGPLTHLDSDGIFDSLNNITTRDLDKITDGTTYKRVTGVNASTNRIQAASSGVDAWAAYRSGSTHAATDKAETRVQFNSEDYDDGAGFDSTTNYRWTAASSACRVKCSAHVTLDNLSDNSLARLVLKKNGTTIKLGPNRRNDSGASVSNFRVDADFGEVGLAKDDYLDVFIYYDDSAGTARNVQFNSISDTTWFAGHQVRAP